MWRITPTPRRGSGILPGSRLGSRVPEVSDRIRDRSAVDLDHAGTLGNARRVARSRRSEVRSDRGSNHRRKRADGHTKIRQHPQVVFCRSTEGSQVVAYNQGVDP
jgi:hypothetical protein